MIQKLTMKTPNKPKSNHQDDQLEQGSEVRSDEIAHRLDFVGNRGKKEIYRMEKERTELEESSDGH